MNQDIYVIYTKFRGMSLSGTKLEKIHFGASTLNGFEEFDERSHVAATLAVEHTKMNGRTLTKKELESEVKRLTET